MRKILRRGAVPQSLTFAVGCFGLLWGVSALSGSEATDEFRDVDSRLLHSDSFNRTVSANLLSSQTAANISPCETHSQRALLLMEMPLTEAALRAGATVEFDQRVQSLENRSRNILSCTPRQSITWLLMFNLAILHGRLNHESFKLLEMSYETSPNEAWISVRRIIVAAAQVPSAPEPLRNQILDEFQRLIITGFMADAARAYFFSSKSAREILQTRIDQLDISQQKSFAAALLALPS
jgi:hypothetical protein